MNTSYINIFERAAKYIFAATLCLFMFSASGQSYEALGVNGSVDQAGIPIAESQSIIEPLATEIKNMLSSAGVANDFKVYEASFYGNTYLYETGSEGAWVTAQGRATASS